MYNPNCRFRSSFCGFFPLNINKAQTHTSNKQCFNYLVSSLFSAHTNFFPSLIVDVSLIYFNFIFFLLAFHFPLILPLAETISFPIDSIFLVNVGECMQIDAIKIDRKRYFPDTSTSMVVCVQRHFFEKNLPSNVLAGLKGLNMINYFATSFYSRWQTNWWNQPNARQ